jgi:hypothetical protein
LWFGAQGKARMAIRSTFTGRPSAEWHGLKCFGIWLANRENLAHKLSGRIADHDPPKDKAAFKERTMPKPLLSVIPFAFKTLCMKGL